MSDEPKAQPEPKVDEASAPEAPKETLEMSPELAKAAAEAAAIYGEGSTSGEGSPPESDPEGVEVPVEVAPRPPTSGAGEDAVRAMAMEKLRQLKERVEVLEGEKKALEERLLRSAADLENFKKRKAREAEQERKFANEAILKELLPVLDNMERALEAKEGATVEQYVAGVEMVHKSFLDALGRFGIERFSALGQPFDPERMEAMQQVESAEHPPGTVITEYLKGFTLHGRLLRPSMVVVSAAPASAATRPVEASGESAPAGEAARDPAVEGGEAVDDPAGQGASEAVSDETPGEGNEASDATDAANGGEV